MKSRPGRTVFPGIGSAVLRTAVGVLAVLTVMGVGEVLHYWDDPNTAPLPGLDISKPLYLALVVATGLAAPLLVADWVLRRRRSAVPRALRGVLWALAVVAALGMGGLALAHVVSFVARATADGTANAEGIAAVVQLAVAALFAIGVALLVRDAYAWRTDRDRTGLVSAPN